MINMAERGWCDVDLTPLGKLLSNLNIEGYLLRELCLLRQMRTTFLRQLGNCLMLQRAGGTLEHNLGFDIIVWKLSMETSHWTV